MFRLIAVLAVVFVTGCATTTVREHPELESRLHQIESVVIAPAAVSIQQINFTGENEQLVEMEESIRAELMQLAKVQLEEGGYEVIDFDFDSAIAEDEDLAYTITQVREEFGEAKSKLYQRYVVPEEEKRSIQASVGTAVNMVSERSGADAVLLMHYTGAKKSAGSVAKDVAVSVMVTLLTGSTPVSNSESSYVEVAFIDGVTGDVIWTNILNSPQLSSGVASVAFKTLPEDIDPIAMETNIEPNLEANVE